MSPWYSSTERYCPRLSSAIWLRRVGSVTLIAHRERELWESNTRRLMLSPWRSVYQRPLPAKAARSSPASAFPRRYDPQNLPILLISHVRSDFPINSAHPVADLAAVPILRA